jgi:hypothetical protein
MEAKARGLLTDALRDGHRWLDELIADPGQAIEAVAMREGKSERRIRRSLSLAFLCPSLVQAVIEGRLPRGFGVKRLMDLPLIWIASADCSIPFSSLTQGYPPDRLRQSLLPA